MTEKSGWRQRARRDVNAMDDAKRIRWLGGRWTAASWGVALAALAVGGLLTASAFAGVVKYDSTLTISRALPLYHGKVKSSDERCERGRRVTLFEKQPGADDKVGSDRTNQQGRWKVKVPTGDLQPNDRFYAKVRRKLRIVSADGYVCRGDTSRTLTFVGD
jgi:hypothetical protein